MVHNEKGVEKGRGGRKEKRKERGRKGHPLSQIPGYATDSRLVRIAS